MSDETLKKMRDLNLSGAMSLDELARTYGYSTRGAAWNAIAGYERRMGLLALTPGNKIAKLRESLYLSQSDIADVLGVRRSTVGAYENRTNANPGAEAVRTLSETYQVPLEWFYDGKNTAPPRVLPAGAERTSEPPRHPFSLVEAIGKAWLLSPDGDTWVFDPASAAFTPVVREPLMARTGGPA